MYSAIAANKRNTIIIIGLFVALLSALSIWWGIASGNGSSALFIVGFVLVYTIFQYYMSGKIAIGMTGAVEIQKSDNPRLWRLPIFTTQQLETNSQDRHPATINGRFGLK